MAATAPPASCISTDGCVMFDCLTHLWEWIDPPMQQNQFQMENKKTAPATQQPLTQQHHLSHHVHPDQIYSQHPQLSAHLTSTQTNQIQPNGVMHQLLQSQYHSNMNARSPLLENRHELYGTGNNQDYSRNYGANDNYNYPQSPPRDRTELHTDHNVNHELLQNMPKGYNAEVYQDYLKRNPPKDTNQIYQNHQPMYRPTNNVNQYGSKPYLPYSNRIGSQSNTEQLRRQYNEIQQMKLQQQMHYQSQAQIHQQQKFAERQILLQQIHGVQPPPNLQNSIYSDGSYRDLDRCSSKDFKDFSSSDIQKEVDRYAKNNEFVELEKQNRQYQEWQPNSNNPTEFREHETYRRQSEGDKEHSQSPPEFNNQTKNNVGVDSPMKSSESSSPSVKSPSSDSRRSSSGTQALRSPIAQRIPSAPVAMSGILYKQGSDGLKVWRKRWFVLSEYCLFYYKSQDEEKLLGSVLLPSYRVSACTTEDKVLRKFAFKLEHANMRTYILAAPELDAMIKWVKVLTMAALMQSPNDQQKPSERPAAKTEVNDDIPGPTYANAPPKPRRSNEGYNSPSPETYDPNYDLLKKPASHYSQSTGHTRHPDMYPNNSNHEPTYTRSPPPNQHYQKRPYDSHNLSLPLTNTVTERLDQPSTSIYRNNPQSTYFDKNRPQENQEQIYERQPQRNPFIQETPTETTKEIEMQMNRVMEDRTKSAVNESYAEQNAKSNNDISYNRDMYGELNSRLSRAGSAMNERLLIERRTPDAYGRSTTMSAYSKGKVGDYEDVYSAYATENEYGKAYAKSPNVPQARDTISISSNHQQQESAPTNYPQEKTFSGPSVLRRKKMQANGIQPPMPRPHSADFLEYESKNEILNKTMPTRTTYEPPKQPQRPKSSLDIHSYYDPSSDRYYSEESYAAKMRQSAQYLQQGSAPRNIQIPLAKYASGLAEKQIQSPFPTANNNYETEFSTNKANRQNASANSKFNEPEGLNSNWTLKEKEIQKEALNRSGSVMSDGMESNSMGFAKDINRFDPTAEGFTRSRSARLPSSTLEKEGDKKVQQREESMKRLLEWKQRMLQSPLTRKSTPATISLARSLNQSRQSLRSDQFKPKTYTNASYNSYSSDDEETPFGSGLSRLLTQIPPTNKAETSGTELQKPSEMQAGRSQKVNLTSPIVMQPATPHASLTPLSDDGDNSKVNDVCTSQHTENTYENVLCTISIPKIPEDKIYGDNDMGRNDIEVQSPEGSAEQVISENESKIENGYETHESEAESEILEYTDNDLDEVLLQSDEEIPKCDNKTENNEVSCEDNEPKQDEENETDKQPETPPVCLVEGHYLPMSPRKISTVEPATKFGLESFSVFDDTRPPGFEDNPYVEMTVGSSEDDMQNYELVCVNNGRVEPVYMEVGNATNAENAIANLPKSGFQTDTASNFADTKDQTLKRVVKSEKNIKDKSDCSDADDESSREVALDAPFSRFSISDTFRPASYYLRNKKSVIDQPDSSDSEIFTPPVVSNSSTSCDDLTDEALSKYVLEKLDRSDILPDNSILRMLTSEKQKMNTVKRKTTSLMIYGSRTSLSDTLSRGEKVRNSRASLTNDRIKFNESTSSLLVNSIIERCNSSSIESDSIRSYNADRGSSRLSIESDISSKFEAIPSNISSEVASLNESESAIELRNPRGYQDVDMMIKRRPLSDDSLFDLPAAAEIPFQCDSHNQVDLDSYLDNLQPSTSDSHVHATFTCSGTEKYPSHIDTHSATTLRTMHMRCSSTPVNTSKLNTLDKISIAAQYKKLDQQASKYIGSNTSCSSLGMPKSPISYYCKSYEEETLLSKNFNNDILADKIREFENEKVSLKTGNETNTSSSTTTGFHSRESSTEHSAPYYYSDLSSQEHINLMPTSHFLKNTNLHRKLNNQRRRGPLHKKNEISHIHNPIHNNQVLLGEKPFELAAARSVSVEFLHAAEKDPEIDLKNIYESTGGRNSKIPESMSLISGLGCKRNSNNNSHNDSSSPESSVLQRTSLKATSSSIKVSNASMSSHCSGNSSNTVYYDAEAEASAYENVLCQGEKHWDEDALWRDNLRRVSHKHARSMDDLDTMPLEMSSSARISDVTGMNSIKRVKKCVANKLSRNVTYVNSDIQNQVLKCRENNSSFYSIYTGEEVEADDDDVYVSLAENAEPPIQHVDEGVYEQLAVELSNNSLISNTDTINQERNKKSFEIDREKLRQWDLMSRGLMQGGTGRVRVAGAGLGRGDALSSKDTRTDTTSNEASMTMSGANLETGLNNSSSNQQALSNKSFLGSNTSIGRNNRDSNIPVRAVSPRVRWVEEKPANDQYRSQQMSTSQQNLHTLNTSEDLWSTLRSPSRASQQPIRAVSPRIRRNTENDDMRRNQGSGEFSEIPSAGDLLGRTHEELVLLLIQLRRKRTATNRAIEACCAHIRSIEDSLGSLKAAEREESLQRLEQLKMQLMDLEHQYEKSKPLVQLVDNMVKLGSLYNRPGSTVERLERNQRLRHKVLAEHASEQQRWLESAAAGRPLETEAARARVAELWALEQELADEASILQGLKTDKDTIESMLTGVRGKLDSVPRNDYNLGMSLGHTPNMDTISPMASYTSGGLEAELARVHAMLAHNSKKLEQTVADNARLERSLQQLRRALQARRSTPHPPQHATEMLEDEVVRVQQLVSALQRQRQELSRAVRLLTQQSHALQTHDAINGKQRPLSSWQETNLDSGHTIDHGFADYEFEAPYGGSNVQTPLYVDTRGGEVTSPLTSEEMQHGGFANLSNVEKQEIKTVRIVKRESERRQRDRERSLQPMSDWPTNNITTNLDQYIEDELVHSLNHTRASSVPRTDYSKFEEYYSKPEPPTYLRLNDKNMDLSPKFPSSPSLSYDYSQNISSMSNSYSKSYDRSGYDRTISVSNQYLNSPTDSSRTLTNDPISKTSSIVSLTRSNMELSPMFKSEAAKQIITEMSGDPKNGSLHRRQVPKEKRRHYTAPHHLSAKTLNEMPQDMFNQDKLGRSLDDADMERALRGQPAPDVVRSAVPTLKFADSTIDQLLAAPQKILIPERYVPEKPPELSPEEQQKRQEKVESIKKMLSGSSADPNKSPEGEEKKQREHLLQMNQILAKQVTEMSKIIAVKALEELPLRKLTELDDVSPDVELPIYQQRDNYFT